MKALKLIAITVFALATMTACTTKEYYSIDREIWSTEVPVDENAWELVRIEDTDNKYYEFIYEGLPLQEAYFNGIVAGYMFLKYDTKFELQVPMPYIIYDKDNVFGEYSIQYSYDVQSNGSIAFKAYVNDFDTDNFSPGNQVFRVAIMGHD